jgi:hypothetical protein
MWDDHWCPNAAKRVAEMAKPMNELVRLAREKGLLIIHAPSSTVDFYKDTPAHKRAKELSALLPMDAECVPIAGLPLTWTARQAPGVSIWGVA